MTPKTAQDLDILILVLNATKSEYEFIGDKGWLKCHTVWAFDKDIPVISWGTDAGESGEEKLAPANHFTLEIEHFSDCVLNNKTPLLSFADARANCDALKGLQDKAFRACNLTSS